MGIYFESVPRKCRSLIAATSIKTNAVGTGWLRQPSSSVIIVVKLDSGENRELFNYQGLKTKRWIKTLRREISPFPTAISLTLAGEKFGLGNRCLDC